jgi:hypothetical protein
MSDRTAQRAAVLLASVLTVDALLHLYWATGSTWPGLRGEQRPGWCWLQSRFLLLGVAAAPDGDGTRVAFTGGVRVPGRAALVPLGVRREGERSLRRLRDLL